MQLEHTEVAKIKLSLLLWLKWFERLHPSIGLGLDLDIIRVKTTLPRPVRQWDRQFVVVWGGFRHDMGCSDTLPRFYRPPLYFRVWCAGGILDAPTFQISDPIGLLHNMRPPFFTFFMALMIASLFAARQNLRLKMRERVWQIEKKNLWTFRIQKQSDGRLVCHRWSRYHPRKFNVRRIIYVYIRLAIP